MPGDRTGASVIRAGESDEEFAQCFERDAMPLLGQLYGVALRVIRNFADVKDLVQETYTETFQDFCSYRPGTNLKAQLYRVLTNAYTNSHRKAQRRPAEYTIDDITDSQTVGTTSHTPLRLHSAEIEVLEELPDGEIRDVLVSPKGDYRVVVYYADAEGLPYKEIAEIMGTLVGTAMSRLHRGRKRLRDALHNVAVERGFLKGKKGDSPR